MVLQASHIFYSNYIHFLFLTAFDDDLGGVCEVLEDLAGQWCTIATNLRLREGSMNTIETNNCRDVTWCLQLDIREWMKLNFNYERNGWPSWRTLAKAVCKLDGIVFDRIVREPPAGQYNYIYIYI